MRLLAIISLSSLLTVASSDAKAQNTNIIVQPFKWQVVGDTATINLWIQSDTVVANLSAWSYNPNTLSYVIEVLTYDAVSGYYTARFPFTGFPSDTFDLFIGSSANAVQVIHDASLLPAPNPPQLIIEKPLPFSVGDPALPVKAKAIDNTDSTRLVFTIFQRSIFSGTYTEIGAYWDSVNTNLDLSAFDGKESYLLVHAIDSNKMVTVWKPIPIYVDSSSYLIKHFVANGRILDFNYNKLLVIDEGWQSNPRIIDVPGGNSIAIPYNGLLTTGYLTPQGAVLSTYVPGAPGWDSLYDFNNGSLFPLGLQAKGTLMVAGNYCSWSYGEPKAWVACHGVVVCDTLIRRDLANQTNLTVSVAAARLVNGKLSANSLQQDGSVVYIDSGANIMGYRDNAYSLLVGAYNCMPPLAANPVHDSVSVAYTQVDEYLTRTNWNKATITGGYTSFAPTPVLGYQVSGKYMARTRVPPGSPGNVEVYRVDTFGNQQLLTTGLYGTVLELLTPSGDLMCIVSNRRTMIFEDGGVVAINSTLGKTYLRAGEWYIAIGNTLYKVSFTVVPDPPLRPAITGVFANYCDNQGIQKIRISNWPDTNVTTVSAKLDATPLTVHAADSSVSFNVGEQSDGAHTVTVTFTNIAGSNDTSTNFTIAAAVTPNVNVAANITQVVNLTDQVVVTASNVAGGGSTPLYTFARDKNFTNVLQAEGTSATLIIDPSTLVIGDNKVYVRMKTSATCYVVQTNIDSILIKRDAATGIIDPNNPSQIITVFPNPFGSTITLKGLNSGKRYGVVIFNVRGQAVYSGEMKNKQVLEIPASGIKPGVYWLTLYDEKKKVLGTERIVKY